MILGLGIDLLENSRFEQELSRGEWLLNDGVFTPDEIGCCGSSKEPALRYAAYLAAKEATLKALGLRVSDLGMFREVEVERGNDNEYKVILRHRLKAEAERLAVRRIHLAIAQSGNQTGAIVILEA